VIRVLFPNLSTSRTSHLCIVSPNLTLDISNNGSSSNELLHTSNRNRTTIINQRRPSHRSRPDRPPNSPSPRVPLPRLLLRSRRPVFLSFSLHFPHPTNSSGLHSTPGHQLEAYLNKDYGPGNPIYEDLCDFTRQGLKEGWVANFELDGAKYRRSKILLPSAENRFFSITTVYMESEEEVCSASPFVTIEHRSSSLSCYADTGQNSTRVNITLIPMVKSTVSCKSTRLQNSRECRVGRVQVGHRQDRALIIIQRCVEGL